MSDQQNSGEAVGRGGRVRRVPWRMSTRVVVVYAVVMTTFFLCQWWWRKAPLFTEVLTDQRTAFIPALGKLISMGIGSFYAAKCARHYAQDNSAGSDVRRSWLLYAAWLGTFALGQACLDWYAVILHQTPPLPSLGDGFFFLGYGLWIAALFGFVSAYRASGFAVGGAREPLLIALACCAVFAVVGRIRLVPIALAPSPLGERIVNVGYPLLDLVTLIPTAILLAITLRFRGGQVWRVWAVILAGILFATGGDWLDADSADSFLLPQLPMAHLTYTLAYALSAYGARLQYELVSES